MCHGQMLGDALLRARKPHRCSECKKEIPAKRLYRRYAWIDGGYDAPDTVKLCERCNALLDTRTDRHDACYYLGEVRRDTRENTLGGGWWRELRVKLREHILRNRKTYGKA